jgi:predicted nucleotidyltransferase
MDKRKVLEIVKEYAEVVKENFPVRKIILYGSRARETALEDSDIDVAVVMDSVQEDFLSTGAMLFTLGPSPKSVLSGFRKSFDFVVVSHKEESDLIREFKQDPVFNARADFPVVSQPVFEAHSGWQDRLAVNMF